MTRNLNDYRYLTTPIGLSKNDNVRALSRNMSFDSVGSFVEERQRIERKLTQIYESEPRVDFSDFANHVTFDSAVSKFAIAKDRILNKYPFNGDSETQDLYAISSSLYERYTLSQWPKAVGYAYYDSGNAFVSASDNASNLYVGPSQSLYVSVRAAPALPGVTNTVLSVLSGSSLGHYYGYTLFTTDTSMTFRVISGSLQYDYTGYFPTASIRNQMSNLAVMYDANALTLSMYMGASRKYFQPLNMGNRLTFGPSTLTVGSSFSGAIGEVRLLLTASDAFHQKYYNRPITSEDYVQLNYRFNEGTTNIQMFDQNVIDYSQSKLHGQVVNFTSSFRRSGSTALNDPGDPILYPAHSAVVAYTSSQETSASYYDDLNKSYMLRLIPEEILEDDQQAGGLYTAFSLAMSRFFDELKMYFDQSDNVRVVGYTGTDEAPDLMLPFMKKYFGWKATDHFSDSNPLQFFFGDGVTKDGSLIMPLVDIKNQFWRRILENLPYLLKTKGKRGNIEALFNVLGINSSNLNLKEFGTATPSSIADEWIGKDKEVSCLNLTGDGAYGVQVNNTKDELSVEVHCAISPLATGSCDVITTFAGTNIYISNLTIPTPTSGTTYTLQFSAGSNRSFKASGTPESAQQIFGALLAGANIGQNLSANLSGTGNAAVLTIQSLVNFSFATSHIVVNTSTQVFAASVSCFPPLSGSPGGVVFYTPDGQHLTINNPPIFNGEMAHYSIVSRSGSLTYGLRQYYNGGLYSTSSTLPTANWYSGSIGATVVFGGYNYSYASFMEGRVWTAALRSRDLDAHAYDFSNVGEPGVLHGSASALFARYPLSQDFSDISGNGQNLQVYEPTTSTNLWGTRFVDYAFLSPTFDLKWTQNKIRVRNSSSLRMDELARDTNKLALEFNLVDSLNEDISRIFSTMDEMNTIIGAPINKYRDGYVELEAFRDIYFQRLTDSLNFNNFFKLFRWFDKKLSNSIKQLVPARADFVGGEFVVDSHMFERNKYQYLYPIFHTPKDINEGAVTIGKAQGATQALLNVVRPLRGTSVRSRDEREIQRYGKLTRDNSVSVEAALMPNMTNVSSLDYVKTNDAPSARLSGFRSNSSNGALATDSSNYKYEGQRRTYDRRLAKDSGEFVNPSMTSGLWNANAFVFSNIDSDDSDLHYAGMRKNIQLRLIAQKSGQSQFTCGPSAVTATNPTLVLTDGQNFPLDSTYQGYFSDWNNTVPRVNATLSFAVSASYTVGNLGFNPADFVFQYADSNTLQWPQYFDPITTRNATAPFGFFSPIKNQPGWYRFMMTLNGLDVFGQKSTQTIFSLAAAAAGMSGINSGFRITMQNTMNQYVFKDVRLSFYAPLSDTGVRYFNKISNSHVLKKIVYRNSTPFKPAGDAVGTYVYAIWSNTQTYGNLGNFSYDFQYGPVIDQQNILYSIQSDVVLSNNLTLFTSKDLGATFQANPISLAGAWSNFNQANSNLVYWIDNSQQLAIYAAYNSGGTSYYVCSLDGSSWSLAGTQASTTTIDVCNFQSSVFFLAPTKVRKFTNRMTGLYSFITDVTLPAFISSTTEYAASIQTANVSFSSYAQTGGYAIANGSATVNGFSSTTNILPGMVATGPNIPSNTTVTSVGANSVTLSNAATANCTSGSQVLLNFFSPLFIATTAGAVLRSTDQGATWPIVLSSSGVNLPYSINTPQVLTCAQNGYVYAVVPQSSSTGATTNVFIASSSTGNFGTWGKSLANPFGSASIGVTLGNDNKNRIFYDVFTQTNLDAYNFVSRDNGASWQCIDYNLNSQIKTVGSTSDATKVVKLGYVHQGTQYALSIRTASVKTNSNDYAPKYLASSQQYFSMSNGLLMRKFLLGNINEYPHFGGLFQMKNLVLGTTTQGTIGVNDDAIVQIKHVGSVVGVLWPDQSQLSAPVPGFGELSPGQSPGKASTSFTFGQAFDCTNQDHVSLYCYALKQTSGTLEDIQIQIQRRPLTSVGFATDQSVEYSPSGSITEARYKDIYHTKQIDYGDMTNTQISYVIDVPLTNVKELRLGVRQKNGQVDANQNFLVWGRFIDSAKET